ncbi:hypothetical protein ES705_48267 [subsurface metagenome]
MKFIVDCMLGKLAKWLKILGFDTLYFSKIEDSDFLAMAKKEERVLLTRDTGMIEKSRDIKSLFIESEDWKDQVRQVLDAFALWEDVHPNSRFISLENFIDKIFQFFSQFFRNCHLPNDE